jgi:hypothetical protein
VNDVTAFASRALLRARVRASRVPAIAALAVTGVCLALCAVCELWFLLVDVPLGFDEGYIGALAVRLLDGGMLPGVDAVGQRGPAFYWLAAVAQALFGRYHWYGLRWVTWLAASGVVVGLTALATTARKPMAGAIGASFYVWLCFSWYEPGTGYAMNGEQVVAPLLVAAVLCTALAVRREQMRARLGFAVLAGLLVAAAGWTKITMLAAIAPLALWTVVVRPDGASLSSRAGWLTTAALLGGWLVPIVAVPLVYVAAGQFDEFVYRFFTYNRDVYMGPYAKTPVWPEIGRWLVTDRPPAYAFLGCVGLALVYAGYLAAAAARRDLRAKLANTDVMLAAMLLAAITFASGIAQMRFWGHHFVAAMPWAGLLLGFAIEAALSPLHNRARAGAAVVIASALIVGLGATAGQRAQQRERERRAGAFVRGSADPLCADIHRYAGPDDPIFIWGFDADLHVSCARKVATRFVYTTLVAGIVPPFWSETKKERVARDAPALTLQDLEQSKPPLILDMPTKLYGVKITSIRELRRFLKKQYCNIGDFTGTYGRTATFYARRDRGFCDKAARPRKK